MPRLVVLALGARLPAWAEAACADYARRMPRGYALERRPLKSARGARAAAPRGARLVALDERGRSLDTRGFAALVGGPAAFLVGGADGLDDAARRDADLVLSLSPLTLPHALAEVVLVEQIYRAATLATGHPYHRGER